MTYLSSKVNKKVNYMLFPKLKNKTIGYLNLDTESKDLGLKFQDVSQFLDPNFCEDFVNRLHEKNKIDYSYGGWLEDRSYLWHGSYMEKEKNFIHVGVDFNVPYMTKVCSDVTGKVVIVDADYPDVGGWGNRVIIYIPKEKVYIIYAHLDKKGLPKVGDKIIPGSTIGFVGKTPNNGFWFPHLHVQVVEKVYFEERWKKDISLIDGYVRKEDLEKIYGKYIDPMNFVKMK